MFEEDVLDLLDYEIDYEDEEDYDYDYDDIDDMLDAMMEEDDEDDLAERRRRRRRRSRGRRRSKGRKAPVVTASSRRRGRLEEEVRRNAKGIKIVTARVAQVDRRVNGVVAVNTVQGRHISKLDKRSKLDGALEFAESWNGQTVDLFPLFKGAVKSGMLDSTKGAFASPIAIGGVGLLLNILRNNPQGLGAIFGRPGGTP